MITLVLGGSRSGKSEVGERLAARHDAPVTYIATGVVTDEDFADRIERHRNRRPPEWDTVELGRGGGLAATLRSITGPVLVDSLGTWVAGTTDFAVDLDELCAALVARHHPTIVVSDEVGMGVHPATEMGRAFRDALGNANRRVADVAHEVLLVVAGRVLPLERP
ncbi:MAG: bifunctional adenosylcobinamide kinase/adenosylcobinamide-phosphate guanylyltransferase [Actinomycetota bacterium]|nr:bifunctional adenosylcobinamide kinase/adenosylcobinamide-phosphate guanylyltransferase [Actinomycetota bacterium]